MTTKLFGTGKSNITPSVVNTIIKAYMQQSNTGTSKAHDQSQAAYLDAMLLYTPTTDPVV